MLSVLAIAMATASVVANNNTSIKKAKAKQATCISCPKGQKCAKTVCTKPSCCK